PFSAGGLEVHGFEAREVVVLAADDLEQICQRTDLDLLGEGESDRLELRVGGFGCSEATLEHRVVIVRNQLLYHQLVLLHALGIHTTPDHGDLFLVDHEPQIRFVGWLAELADGWLWPLPGLNLDSPEEPGVGDSVPGEEDSTSRRGCSVQHRIKRLQRDSDVCDDENG